MDGCAAELGSLLGVIYDVDDDAIIFPESAAAPRAPVDISDKIRFLVPVGEGGDPTNLIRVTRDMLPAVRATLLHMTSKYTMEGALLENALKFDLNLYKPGPDGAARYALLTIDGDFPRASLEDFRPLVAKGLARLFVFDSIALIEQAQRPPGAALRWIARLRSEPTSALAAINIFATRGTRSDQECEPREMAQLLGGFYLPEARRTPEVLRTYPLGAFLPASLNTRT